MAEKTTNFGLTKPLPEEFYDVAVQNGNMDIIDEKLKEAMESSGDITPESIGAEPVNGFGRLPSGTDLTSLNGKNGWYILNANDSYTNIPAEIANTWAVVTIKDKSAMLQGINGHLYYSNNISGTVIDWKEIFTTEGGTLSGDVLWTNGGSGRFYANGAITSITAHKFKGEMTRGFRELLIYSPDYMVDITKGVRFTNRDDNGVDTIYTIYGEHNITKGTTDIGAGSALATGCIHLVYE